MVILTDTDIIIDYLRQKQKVNTIFHTLFIKAINTSAIALITVSELWRGESMNKTNNQQMMEELLKKLEIILPNVETAKLTGELLRKRVYDLSFNDAEIAACAIYHDLPLLTLNQKHFTHIPKLKIYKCLTSK